MYLGSFLLDVVFSDPKLFVWPVTISFGAVCIAAILYTRWFKGCGDDYQLLVQQNG